MQDISSVITLIVEHYISEGWDITMTKINSKRERKAKHSKTAKNLEFVQDFIPIKNINYGVIETTDGRYIKILEIEPINFMLRSSEEQFGIISSFASFSASLPASPQ